MRITYRHALPALAAALLACGPKTPGSTDSDTAGTATDGTTTGPTTAPTTGPMNEPEHTRPSTEEQLCIDLCVNLSERGSADCSRTDYTCYDWCLVDFQYAEECRAEARAARRCEAKATSFDDMWACESPECSAEYAAYDVCRGFCFHLGGTPSSGSSPTQCEYGSDCLDDHSYAMQCGTGDAPLCTCRIDGAEVGTCQLPFALDSDSCSTIELFDGCCNEFFLPVLQPATVDEPIPSEPEAGGTATPGELCPLVGLHLICEQDGLSGVTYCDDIDGSMRFGPCIPAPNCDLLAVACDGTCELIDGIPTWVTEDCMGGTSSG